MNSFVQMEIAYRYSLHVMETTIVAMEATKTLDTVTQQVIKIKSRVRIIVIVNYVFLDFHY